MSSASSLAKVLVVGTTSDYIQWIRRCCPGRALFLTDPQIRKQALEPGPSAEEEILCNLADYKLAEKALKNHLKRFDLHLDGIPLMIANPWSWLPSCQVVFFWNTPPWRR